MRVVLVDDDPATRRLVAIALRVRGGFEVVGEAATGSAGVSLAQTLSPDVLVLDLGLPDLAGKEVLVRLREAAPGTKVMVFSGTETPDRSWIASNAEGFVVKDADIEYLVDALESLGRQPSRQAAMDLAADVTSVSLARGFVRSTLAEWTAGDLADDAQVLVSELVTNAIVHGEGACRLRLAMRGNSLRIEVVDAGPGSPEPQVERWTAEHGRGLHLVTAIATAWGMEAVFSDGKRVWADLARLEVATAR